MQIEHAGDHLLVVKLDAHDEAEVFVQLQENLFAAERIVGASDDNQPALIEQFAGDE